MVFQIVNLFPEYSLLGNKIHIRNTTTEIELRYYQYVTNSNSYRNALCYILVV